MRFVIYKNSILATICSMFGAACIAMGVAGVIGKEIGILEAAGVIVVGIALMWLAGVISDHKEKRKRAKAAAKNAQAASAKAASSGAGYTQSSRADVRTAKTVQTVQTAAKANNADGKAAKASAVFAGICFLIAAAGGLYASYLYGLQSWHYVLGIEAIAKYIIYFALMIGCFATRKLQRASFLHVFGFLGLVFLNARILLPTPEQLANTPYLYNQLVRTTATVNLVVCAVMFFYALWALINTRSRLCGVIRYIWYIPWFFLAVAFVAGIYEGNVLMQISTVFQKGGLIGLSKLPGFFDVLSKMGFVLGVFFTGVAFLRVWRNPFSKPVQTSYAQPEPRPAATQYTAPQPEPRYTAPEPPRQAAKPEPAAQSGDQEIEKKLQAYKDLLECGILSLDEFEQKLRELKRG